MSAEECPTGSPDQTFLALAESLPTRLAWLAEAGLLTQGEFRWLVERVRALAREHQPSREAPG